MLSRILFNIGGLPFDYASIPVFVSFVEPKNKRFFVLVQVYGYIIVRLLIAILGRRIGILVIPCLAILCVCCGSGTKVQNFVGFIVCFAFINVLQMPTLTLWTAMYGVPPDAVAENVFDYPAHFLFQMMNVMFLLAAARALDMVRGFYRKRSLPNVDVPLVFLLIVQTLWFLPIYLNDWAFLFASAAEVAFLAFCHAMAFAATILLVSDASSAIQAASDETQAEVLSEAAKGYERHYREVEQVIARAAVLRHELRNRMQVAAALAEQGNVSDAAALLDAALRDRVDLPLSAVDDGSAQKSEVTRRGGAIAVLRRNAGFLVYLTNALLFIMLFVRMVRNGDMSATSLAIAVGVMILWLILTPFLLRTVRKAQEADIAAAKAEAAREMLDARVWYSEKIMADLVRAKELEDGLRAKITEFRDSLEDGAAVALPTMGTAGAPVRMRYCDNRALDTLVALKAGMCADSGIELSCSLDVPRDFGLGDLELCTLFSNLLDNAITSCGEVEAGERWIEAAAEVRAGMLVAVVRNSCADDAAASKGGSAKGIDDQHGWGMRILSELACRHGGSVEADASGGVFTTKVTVFVS